MINEKVNNKETNKDLLDILFKEADNKFDLSYWTPLSKIITESIIARDALGLSQYELATTMNTTQSVISRFENMGRLPSYDFISRLSLSLGHELGITIFGEYMAVVPIEKQAVIKEIAESEGLEIKQFVQSMLEDTIFEKTYQYKKSKNITKYDTSSDDYKPESKKNTTIDSISYEENTPNYQVTI
jgi:transcriptional regulator with XRE-family HTH domain